MSEILIWLVGAFVISYFIGNFCGAIIISKLFLKKDIRDFGSSNAGTTNMSRVFGIKFGIITFIIDCLKGFLCVILARLIITSQISEFWGQFAGYLVGIAVILGHNYPIIFKFKGGKGFASAIGVLFALNPLITAISLIGCLIVIISTDIMSLYAMSFFTVTMLYICIITDIHWSMKICTIIYFVLGIYAHKSNIKRLLKKEERKLGLREKLFKRGASK